MIGEYIGSLVLVAIMGAGIPGPADAALIAAGTLAAQGKLSLSLVLIDAGAAWMCGSVIGHWIGARGGRRLLDHPGHFEGLRGRTLSKGDRLFGRHHFLFSMILPAFVSGIFDGRYRIFLAGVAVAGSPGSAATPLSRTALAQKRPICSAALGSRASSAWPSSSRSA